MSDQSTDPAHSDAASLDPDGGDAVVVQDADDIHVHDENAEYDAPTQEQQVADGTTVVTTLDSAGQPGEVVDVKENTGPVIAVGGEAVPSADYGYRPEPIPGPSVEEIKLMSVEGYEAGPTAQERVMARAQAQADGILKAAEQTVAAMDRAESHDHATDKTLAEQMPKGTGAEHTTPIGDEPATVTAMDNLVREETAKAQAEVQEDTGGAETGGADTTAHSSDEG